MTSMPVHPVVELCRIARSPYRLSELLPFLVANDDADRNLLEIQYIRDGESVVSVHEPEFTLPGNMHGNIRT